MHTCTACRVEKPDEDFYARPSVGWIDQTGQRRGSECKVCTRKRAADWRTANLTRGKKDEYNGLAREKRARIRDAVFGAYGGYRCVCCGETERAFLSLDHVENDGATFRRQILGSRNCAGAKTYAWLHRHGYPAGYQVLCMNCQFGKRMNHGVCPHQQGRRNDHPLVGVGPSGPKRTAPVLLVSNG